MIKQTLNRLNLIILFLFSLSYNSQSLSMEKPYHHLPSGKFQNPKGSPERSETIKWSYRTFNKEKKKVGYDSSKKPYN